MKSQDYDQSEARIAEETRKLNYKVIRKIDENLHEIKYIASYCSIYELDKAIRIWHACDMAGPLYLITTKKGTAMKLILLNQKSNFNFEEEISKDQRFEKNEKEQMIFIQNSAGVVKGLWMNNTEDLLKIHSAMTEFCSSK